MSSELSIKPKPFKYEIVDDFLSPEDFQIVQKAYENLSFKEINSDLFKFLVSTELNHNKDFKSLRNNLDSILSSKISYKNLFYTMSASYYRKGDFLLCHDDMVDGRLWAFAFYLDDLDSTKLLIYENDCETLHEAIDIKRNRIVIFEVGPLSFHEVQRCNEDGRKTISGWINSPGVKNIPNFKTSNFSISKNLTFFELDLDLENEDFISMEFEDLKTVELSKKICGPFINRRVEEIELDSIYAPEFKNYELINSECLRLDRDSYVLINDKINTTVDLDSILDVFIFDCDQNVEKFIEYVDENSKKVLQVAAMNNHLFVGKRNGCGICMFGNDITVKVKHFMYKKLE